MHDWIFPVCSPTYARQHQLADPPTLDGLTILHADGEPWSWWFPSAGIDGEEPARGLVFSDSSLMLQAAIDGQGVGLARQWLRALHRLWGVVCPFSAYAQTPHSYYFVCRKGAADTPSIVLLSPVAGVADRASRKAPEFSAS